jgi:hypothetical protein
MLSDLKIVQGLDFERQSKDIIMALLACVDPSLWKFEFATN